MGDRVAGAHTDLHCDQGARRGEHPGRSRDPIIKVRDIAWLEFERPDLVRAEAFSRAFGFSTTIRTADELYLRGTDAGSSEDLNKTERADLMAKSASGEQVRCNESQ
jgi:hypothetical protein